MNSDPTASTPIDFFVSYTGKDQPWAEWIAWQLEQAGYTTVIQAWDFKSGGVFPGDMHRALQQSTRVIAVLTPDYLKSDFCAPEWQAALARDPTGKKNLLVLVRVADFHPDGLLDGRTYIDLVGKSPAVAAEYLIARLKPGRAKPTIAPPHPGNSTAPSFPGSATTKRPSADGIPPVRPPRLYLSYTLRTPGLADEMEKLCDIIRGHGFDCRLDRYFVKSRHGFTPPQPKDGRPAWEVWQEEEINNASRVLVVASPEYLAAPPNSGVANDLKFMANDLSSGNATLSKYIPVGFGSYSAVGPFIPAFLHQAHYHDLSEKPDGIENLLRRLKSEFPDAEPLPPQVASPSIIQNSNSSPTPIMKAKILFLAANPDGTSSLALDQECRAITDKIRASEHRETLELLTKWAVRPDDLLQHLNEIRPHIVHFSGHGSSSGEIVLHDQATDKAKPVSLAALRALFTTLKDNVGLVVLNACFSRSQAETITEVIDCAVGMNKAIGDKAAIIFAASFYRALGFGRSVKDAFDQGCTALLLEGIPEDATPELLVKEGVDAAQIYFPKK